MAPREGQDQAGEQVEITLEELEQRIESGSLERARNFAEEVGVAEDIIEEIELEERLEGTDLLLFVDEVFEQLPAPSVDESDPEGAQEMMAAHTQFTEAQEQVKMSWKKYFIARKLGMDSLAQTIAGEGGALKMFGDILALQSQKVDIGKTFGEYEPSTTAAMVGIMMSQVVIEAAEEAPEIFGPLANWDRLFQKLGFDRMKMGTEIFNEKWGKVEEKLREKGWNKARIDTYKGRYLNWLRANDIGRHIMRNLQSGVFNPVALLIMGIYIHRAPDRKKATIQYLTFVAAGQGIQKATKLGVMILRNTPGLARLGSLLTRIGGHPAGKAVAFALLIVAIANPKSAEFIQEKAEWIEEQFDDDSVVWKGVGEFFMILDIPFTGVENILFSAGVLSIDPRTDQIDFMKRFVERQHSFTRRVGNISFTHGLNMIDQYNGIIEQKGSSEVEKEFWDAYAIDNIPEWSRSRIPDYYSQACYVQSLQEELEEMLRNLHNPETGEPVFGAHNNLNYFEIATMGGDTSHIDMQIIPTEPSNAMTIKAIEDMDNGFEEEQVQDFFVHELWEDELSSGASERKEKWEQYFEGYYEDGQEYDAWKQQYDIARQKWQELRRVSHDLARETDVYKYLGVFDREMFTNPLAHEEGYIGYLDQFEFSENVRQTLQIDEDREEAAYRQAHDIVGLLRVDNNLGFFDFMREVFSGKLDENTRSAQQAHEDRQQLSWMVQGLSRHWGIEPINTFLTRFVADKILSDDTVTYDIIREMKMELGTRFMSDESLNWRQERPLKKFHGAENENSGLLTTMKYGNAQRMPPHDDERGIIISELASYGGSKQFERQIYILTGYADSLAECEVVVEHQYHSHYFGTMGSGGSSTGLLKSETMTFNDLFARYPESLGSDVLMDGLVLFDRNLQRRASERREAARIRGERMREQERLEPLIERGDSEALDSYVTLMSLDTATHEGTSFYFNDEGLQLQAQYRAHPKDGKEYEWRSPNPDAAQEFYYRTNSGDVGRIRVSDLDNFTDGTLDDDEKEIARDFLCTPRKEAFQILMELTDRHDVRKWEGTILGLGGTAYREDQAGRVVRRFNSQYNAHPDKRFFLETAFDMLMEDDGNVTEGGLTGGLDEFQRRLNAR